MISPSACYLFKRFLWSSYTPPEGNLHRLLDASGDHSGLPCSTLGIPLAIWRSSFALLFFLQAVGLVDGLNYCWREVSPLLGAPHGHLLSHPCFLFFAFSLQFGFFLLVFATLVLLRLRQPVGIGC